MPPDPIAKQLLLGGVLLWLAGTRVASQYDQQTSEQAEFCKWPHNSSTSGHHTEQVHSLNALTSLLKIQNLA
jgi:hypothetical protein